VLELSDVELSLEIFELRSHASKVISELENFFCLLDDVLSKLFILLDMSLKYVVECAIKGLVLEVIHALCRQFHAEAGNLFILFHDLIHEDAFRTIFEDLEFLKLLVMAGHHILSFF
jgi:hypothetical protein